MTRLRRARPLLGTLVEIAIDGDRPRAAAEQAFDRAFAAIARVHALMSYHDPHSEVSRLNREAWLRAVPVSDETWQVLSAAQHLAQRAMACSISPSPRRWSAPGSCRGMPITSRPPAAAAGGT